MSTEQLQLAHYDRVFNRYEAHYDDASSQAYRRRFIYGPMFRGIDLGGKRVLEAMCGSGQTTEYLLSKGARVTGLDLCDDAIASFRRRFPRCEGISASILDTKLQSGCFDCVAVVGGLHHLPPHTDRAVDEIHRLLRPGGHFCFMEPHAGSLPDVVRKRWYRHDDLFAENEAAVDLAGLKHRFAARFEFLEERYYGNLAYLLVLNSMVFRIPLRLKPYYAPPLMLLESILEKLQGKLLSCCVIGRWRKR